MHRHFVMCLFALIAVPGTLAAQSTSKPTAYAHTGTGFTNPGNAYDSNPYTQAGIAITRPCSAGAGTSESGTTWYDLEEGWTPSRLWVKWFTNGNANFTGMTSVSVLEYSKDNGSSWLPFPDQEYQAPPNFSLSVQYVSVALPSGVDSEDLQVRVIPKVTSTGACVFGSSGVAAYVYDIYMERCGDERDEIISEYVDYAR